MVPAAGSSSASSPFSPLAAGMPAPRPGSQPGPPRPPKCTRSMANHAIIPPCSKLSWYLCSEIIGKKKHLSSKGECTTHKEACSPFHEVLHLASSQTGDSLGFILSLHLCCHMLMKDSRITSNNEGKREEAQRTPSNKYTFKKL